MQLEVDRRTLILTTMNSVRSNSMKYLGYTPSRCKEIGIRKTDVLERVLRYKYDLICHSPENKMLRLLFLFTVKTYPKELQHDF